MYVIAAEVKVQIFEAGYIGKLMYAMNNQYAKILQLAFSSRKLRLSVKQIRVE
jgi:hypothetical protein